MINDGELEKICNDIGPFADLDSSIEKSIGDDFYVIGFDQRGEEVRLVINRKTGGIKEHRGHNTASHRSFRGLLATKNFGNLAQVRDAQRAQLKKDAAYLVDGEGLLPVFGQMSDATLSEDSELFAPINDWFNKMAKSKGNRALIIDGPAGVGKTNLVRMLVWQRIKNFGPGSLPLILHIQSRGRKLTGLNDVISGSLDALRLFLTSDQLSILVRHGMIQVAIDGFDELADPNGYENAWADLREFIQSAAGNLTLILAGRDTFIDAREIRKIFTLLDNDETLSVRLSAIPPNEAKKWLKQRGFPENKVKETEEEFGWWRNHYSLRPFFLTQIEKYKRKNQAEKPEMELSFPLRMLVRAILFREAEILTGALQGTQIANMELVLERFLAEIARDMADGERDWIDLPALSLITDLVFGELVNSEELAMLHNRVRSLALLEQDSESNRRRFPHTQLFHYFFSESLVSALVEGEIPKSVRRNIFGVEFLSVFHNIAMARKTSQYKEFQNFCCEEILRNRNFDRTRGNLAALVISSSYEADGAVAIQIQGVDIDEAYVSGVAGIIQISATNISQLDCRSTDIRNFNFGNGCMLSSLICNEATQLPESLPQPQTLSIEKHGGIEKLFDPSSISDWLTKIMPSKEQPRQESYYIGVLDRVCRIILNQHWVALNQDDFVGKKIDEEDWKAVRSILDKFGLVSERKRIGVQGKAVNLIRINEPAELLNPSSQNTKFAKARRMIADLG